MNDLDLKNIAALRLLTNPRRRNGAGRLKVCVAEMISKLLNCECDPERMWVQNPVFARWGYDLARWGVSCTVDGRPNVNVHSFDRMTTIVKAGKICVIGDTKDTCIEVSACE